jgi:hypothetical protein
MMVVRSLFVNGGMLIATSALAGPLKLVATTPAEQAFPATRRRGLPAN